jgi:O-antigen ligase
MYSATFRSRRSLVQPGLIFCAFALGTIVTLAFPRVVLGSLAAGVSIALGVMFPVGALCLYTASLFFFQVSFLTDIPVAVPTAAGLFLISAAILHRLITRSPLMVRSRLPRMLALLSLVFLVGALIQHGWFASHPRGLFTYFALCGSAIAVSLVLNSGTIAWTVAKIFVAGSNLISLLAIYETWTGHYNAAGLFEGQEDRAYGLADPNYTAALIVTLLPFVVALFLCARTWVAKLWAGLSLAGGCLAITMTASRGGIIGTFLTALAVFALVASKKTVGPSGPQSKRPGFTGSRLRALPLLLAVLAIASVLAPGVLWDRLSTYDNWSNPHKEGRLRIWSSYLGQWKESPWWGRGPGYVEDEVTIYHNTPLQFLVETGVFGLLIFVVVNVTAFVEVLRARTRFAEQGRSDLAILCGAIAAALVGFHSTAFFLTSGTHKELWFLLGLTAAMHNLSLRPHGERHFLDADVVSQASYRAG